MKCTLSETPYQWHDGRQWHVGRLVNVWDFEHERIVDRDCGLICRANLSRFDFVLVRHAHTGELEFVEWGKLKPYPHGVIPEPTNTGTTTA